MTQAVRRYAETTKVLVEKSQADLRALFKRAGADQIAIYESQEKSSIAFRIAGRFYRLTVGGYRDAQDERRLWRLLLLLVKAKLEAVREGVSTIEHEFLADTIMPDGSTIAELAASAVALAYEKGEMPTRFLIEGPK